MEMTVLMEAIKIRSNFVEQIFPQNQLKYYYFLEDTFIFDYNIFRYLNCFAL
jgi:hypothetical protein